MKRSIDDVSNTILVHANTKPVFRSKSERQQIALQRLEKQLSIQYNQTPREQRRDRRDRVREEENKVREKDRIIEKQAKKRETEEEVESIKEQYFRMKKVWGLLPMESYETFACPCGRGDVVERTSHRSHSYGRVYYACPFSKPMQKDYGCGYFKWKDEHELRLIGSSGPSTPSSSFLGPYGSALIHGNEECSNCKLLAIQKKILGAALDMERHPENHTCQSVAIIHEVLNDMENLG